MKNAFPNMKAWYNRYVAEPARRQREKEEAIETFTEQKEDYWNLLLYWFIGVLIPPALFFFQVITAEAILAFVIPFTVIMLIVYHTRPRYCKGCRKEMKKETTNEGTYFVCMECRTRIRVYLNNQG